MTYVKQTWQTGDVITAEKLNHMENGIEAVEAEIPTSASDISAIPAPSSPATGAFLVWNGTAWVAQTLSAWQGGSY